MYIYILIYERLKKVFSTKVYFRVYVVYTSVHWVGGVISVASCITMDELLQYNRCCYFPDTVYASLGLFLFLSLLFKAHTNIMTGYLIMQF